jgi:hypothetical protein
MKKVLSFVLVLAMILGSVSMVFAASFTDDAAITNKEASAVLAAAGVIEGYTDGSFKPTQTLTRAEGAAILARMVLGKSDAAKLTTVVSPFNDVPATHWAAGYISYCVAQGFINGYGNGNFGPDDTLTVAAFGKMMLTAVGYKSANEGFTGDAWETNVGSVMVKAGLTDGVTITGSNACTREVAAQVALNTLKADLVEYDGTPVSVSTGTVTVTTGQSAAKKVTAPAAEAGNYKNTTDGIRQFMEEYQKDLKLSGNISDDFGRPNANQWTYKNENVYKAKSTKNLIASYTNKVTQGTLYQVLDDHDALAADIVVYRNGKAGANIVQAQVASAAAAGINKNNTDAYNSGNGSQVEVYYDSTPIPAGNAKGLVTIVVTDYFLGQAVGDYKASAKELKLAVAGANKTVSNKDFAIENAKDEDYFVVTMADGTVKTLAPATEVTGTITAYKDNSDITVDGTKYTKSGVAQAGDYTLTGLTTGTQIKVIADPNGYLLATKDATSDTQFVYIKQIAATSGLNADFIADAFFIDGTRQEIKVKKVNGVDPVAATPGQWFNYTVDANGKYTLKNPTVAFGGAASEVKSKNVDFTNTTLPVKGSNDTIFVVLDKNNNVKVYTGFKTVPNTAGVATTRVAYVVDKDAVAFAKYVFIDAKTTATTLYGATSSDYVVLYKSGSVGLTDNGTDKYFSYDKSVINGEVKTVEFSEDVTGINTANVATGLYNNVSYDAAGRVDSAIAVGVPADTAGTDYTDFYYDSAVVATKAAISYKSGVLDLDGKEFKTVEGIAVFVIDARAGYEKLTDGVKVDKILNNLDEGATYRVYVVYNNSTDKDAKAVYFIR